MPGCGGAMFQPLEPRLLTLRRPLSSCNQWPEGSSLYPASAGIRNAYHPSGVIPLSSLCVRHLRNALRAFCKRRAALIRGIPDSFLDEPWYFSIACQGKSSCWYDLCLITSAFCGDVISRVKGEIMPEDKRTEAARKGSEARAEQREQKREAGEKGGEARAEQRERMSEIGRKGGEVSGGRQSSGGGRQGGSRS